MMQFQLRLFSTLVAVIAATQSLPKEHVALVQRHAATFTATETEPESDSDANLVATNTSAACPFGYKRSSKDLHGTSSVQASKSASMTACQKECEKRADCTAFEVGSFLGFGAGCWTYTGGEADIQSGWGSGQTAGYTTCIKTCPSGFVQSTRDLNGDTAEQTSAKDVWGCAKSCEERTGGCTAFEYGTVGKYKGCWTYIDGQADIQKHPQFPIGWTTCTVSFGRWTSERTHSKWGGTKIDVFCGKSTDVFTIENRPSNWCKTNKGCDGQVVVNQVGAERTNAWYCDCQGATELVGVPTFEPDDTCANEHQVADDSN